MTYHRRSVAILLLGLIPAAVLCDEDTQSSFDKLQGTWAVTEAEMGGEPVPKDELEKLKIAFTFTGDKLAIDGPVVAPNDEQKFAVKLDPSKKPKWIDATALTGQYKDKVLLGIYEVEGDTLKLCLTNLAALDRPTEFKSPKGSHKILMTLKRSKK